MAGKFSTLERVYPPRKYSVIELPAAVGLPGLGIAPPHGGRKCSAANILAHSARKYSVLAEALPGRKMSAADITRRLSMIGERHPRPSTSYHHSSAIAESIEESPDSSPVSPRSSRCNSASHRATLAVARRDSTSSPPAATSPSSAVLPVAASPTDSGSAARSSSVTSPRESALAHAIRLSLSDINSLSARRARSVSCYGAYPLQAIALTALPGAHLHLHAAAAAAAAQEPKRRRGTLCKQIRAVKNLLVLALTFLLTFTGFNALRNHASVLQRDASASLVSLCVFYACMSVSGVASAVVTNRLTPKWTIVVAFACYSVYFAANLLPNYYTLVPTAAFAGAMSGPLWNAQTLYLYATARKYAFLTEEIPERVLNRFNRVFGAVYWCSVVVGNIIALLIFTRSDKTAELTDVGRSLRVWAAASACGAAACQAHKPVRYNFTLSYDNGVGGGNIDSVFLLVGIFVGCGLLATALAVGLMDRLEPTAHHVGTRRRSSRFLFNRMLRVMQDSRILVLMVLIFFTGLEQGFIFADFTKSYVFCTLAITDVGYTMVCYGITAVVSVVTISHVTKHINRLAIMGAGLIFHVCLFCVLYLWKPADDDQPVFYVMTAGWALCDIIWTSQIYNLIALLCGDCYEHAYNAYYMIQAAGLSVAFGYSPFLCTETKVFVVGGTLAVGLVIYSIIELRIQKLKKELISSF